MKESAPGPSFQERSKKWKKAAVLLPLSLPPRSVAQDPAVRRTGLTSLTDCTCGSPAAHPPLSPLSLPDQRRSLHHFPPALSVRSA